MNKIVENALAAHRAKNDAEGEKAVNADVNEDVKKEAGKIRDAIVRIAEELEKGRSNGFRFYLEAKSRITDVKVRHPEIFDTLSILEEQLNAAWGYNKFKEMVVSLRKGPATLFDRLAKTGKL